MDQTSKETLKKAINLLKEGDQKAAIPLLTGLLKKEPDLEQGWYLLGMALDAKEQKLRAFRQVLKLNPEHAKAQQQIEKLEKPDLTATHSASLSEEEVRQYFEPPQEEEAPYFDSPFGEPPDTGQAAPEQTMKPDFDLPDWMKQDSFDATDQLPPTPEAYRDMDTSAEDFLRAEEDAEIAEVPDWAKTPGPLPLGPDLNEPREEPKEPETPDWMDSSAIEEEEKSPASQPAFTGYYDDYDEDEGDIEEGEEDIEEGEPEWLRSMVEEDEENGNKKKRKKKEKKKKIKVELSPKEKKQRRRRVLWLFLIVLFSGLGAFGYLYPEKVEPYQQKIVPPVLTQIAPVTDLLTQGAPLTNLLTPKPPTSTPGPSPTVPQQPTMAPTWTPAQTNGANATLLPAQATQAASDAQQTPTSTSLPLPEDTMNKIQAIQEQVVALRQLPGPNTVDNDIAPKPKLRQVIEDWMMQGDYLAELEKDQILYRALGLVNSEYDLVEAATNSRADAIGGFYHPEANRVHVIGSDFNSIEQYIYSHEYAHAIQDANFDLRSLGIYPTCTQAAQACLAIQSLVEGEANLLHNLWFENYPPEEGQQDILNYRPPTTLFQNSPAPQFFAQNALFPYIYGLNFVSYLYENGGWNAVNRAYRVLPATTEQIMHPVKYDQREASMYLAHPDLNAVFDENWELIRNDSLGEWMNFLLLAYNDYPNATQDEKDASVAAAGWGADQYQVYYNASTREVQMSVYWTWDTNIDSDEFYTLLNQYLNARFAGATTDGPGEGNCWAIRGQLTCTYQNGKQILWLLGDDEDLVTAAKQRFSYFP